MKSVLTAIDDDDDDDDDDDNNNTAPHLTYKDEHAALYKINNNGDGR